MEKHEEIKVVYLLKLPTTSNDFIHIALAVTEHFHVHSSLIVHAALRGQRMDSGTPSGEIFFKTLMNGLYTYSLLYTFTLFNYIA